MTSAERGAMCPVGCGVELEPMGRWAPYRTCPSCGTGFWVPPKRRHHWGQGVEPSLEQLRFWGGRHKQWEHLVGPGPGRLVDVGCGFGHFVQWALDHDWDALGYDLDPWAIERSVAAGKVTNDLEALGDDIDVLTLWDVLEHQTSPLAFLEQWRDRLREGGRIIVGVPNFPAMKLRWPALRRNPNRFSGVIQPEEHAVQFTSVGLCRSLQGAGFEAVTTLRPPPSRHPNRAVTWVLRTLPALRGGLFATGIVPPRD